MYECQSVECAFTSPVCMEYVMPVARDVLFGLYGVFLGASFLLFACVGVECCVEHVH